MSSSSNEEMVIVRLRQYYTARVQYYRARRDLRRFKSVYQLLTTVKAWCDMALCRRSFEAWIRVVSIDGAQVQYDDDWVRARAERWTLLPYREDFEDEVRHQVATEFTRQHRTSGIN